MLWENVKIPMMMMMIVVSECPVENFLRADYGYSRMTRMLLLNANEKELQ